MGSLDQAGHYADPRRFADLAGRERDSASSVHNTWANEPVAERRGSPNVRGPTCRSHGAMTTFWCVFGWLTVRVIVVYSLLAGLFVLASLYRGWREKR